MDNRALLYKMRLPVQQNIPVGLIGPGIEIFFQQNEVYGIVGGSCLPFEKWPESLYDTLDADLALHPVAIQSLIDLGLEDRLQMIWQYARCRFGSFDSNPDINATGELQHTEYWDCGFRGECPHEGKLCSSIKAENGIITPREIDVIRLVAEDLMNKEIADKLLISEKTVPVHKQNIIRKIGGKRAGDIIRFALRYNITHNKEI